MITGTVDRDRVPVVTLPVAGGVWSAAIDTGFNGDLELPESMRSLVSARYHGEAKSELAGGQIVLEDLYRVEFPFDGQTISADATFAPTKQILIGTNLLQKYHLDIHFPNRTVLLERVA